VGYQTKLEPVLYKKEKAFPANALHQPLGGKIKNLLKELFTFIKEPS
jgi:hypothetical protein